MSRKQNWISVKERLPEDGEVVFALFDTSDCSEWYQYPLNLKMLNFRRKSPFEQFFRDKESLFPVNSQRVTHWLPLSSLPDPPKNIL